MDPIFYQRAAIIVLITGLIVVVLGRFLRSKYSNPLMGVGVTLMVLAALSLIGMVFFSFVQLAVAA